MTVLVDTSVLYADHDTDATRHDAASAALEAVYDGAFGVPYISDYAYDEAVTLTLTQSGSHDGATRLGKRLRGDGPYPKAYELLRVSSAVFSDAVETFERSDDQRLSFTDATAVELVDRHGIDRVLSFDGLVTRAEPGEVE